MPKEVVEKQLTRIIGSRQFRNAPRLCRFLSYVVQEGIAGRPDRLKGYTIGLEVFDKPEDFDPQTDTIVRVQARALRQKLEQYYAQDGRDDPVRITIAKGSYAAAFFLSWDRKQAAVEDEPAATVPSNKPSIAVLPFDNFSREDGYDFFSHGLTEETIANLSRFRELTVLSRRTTAQARQDNLSIRQIHDQFHPDFVLEGSFRIDSQFVQITINLVETSGGEIILTQHFSHEATPKAMYDIQDEMALAIAAHIADRFGPLGQYARRSAQMGHSLKWDTYCWISRYHQYAFQLATGERQEIRDGLRKALESDPTSSVAHAVLALTTVDEYRMSFDDNTDIRLLDRALYKAEKAVEYDPENATAHMALAIVRFHRREFDLFDASASRALALNPGHPDIFAMLGICYCMRAKWDVAMPLMDKATAIGPPRPEWYHTARAFGLLMTRSAQEAVAEMRLAPLPNAFFYHCHLLWFLVEAGDMDAAQAEKTQLLKVLPDFERVILRHVQAWCLHETMITRAVAAWRKAGLDISR